MSYLSTTLRHYAKYGAISGACALFFLGVAWYAGNLSAESPVWRMVGVMPLLTLCFTPYPDYDQVQARSHTAQRRWILLGHILHSALKVFPWYIGCAWICSVLFPAFSFWQYFLYMMTGHAMIDLIRAYRQTPRV